MSFVMSSNDSALRNLMELIVSGEARAVNRLLRASPALARARLETGATRDHAKANRVGGLGHYVYAGDTALHVAAAAHRPGIARKLIAMGSDPRARNRRGAEPLHYAADGLPGSPWWDPTAQAATVTCLIEAGADPNAVNRSGVTPLHRAVRTRCTGAVEALLKGGADPQRPNKNGSTPMRLAAMTTGRGGSGSPQSKAEQVKIARLLERHGARRIR
jgi:ankyrin repeat protein